MYINYKKKLNDATRKDYLPLPFFDQILITAFLTITLAIIKYLKPQNTCPFGIYVFKRMPFELYNAPITFQICILSIFGDMVENYLEIFMHG